MTFRDPREFENDLDALEDVERITARLIATAMNEFLDVATNQFAYTAPLQGATDYGDLANYVGEDMTRIALSAISPSRVPGGRLFGAVDFKAAAIQFLPEFSVKQALLVDSKAEMNAFNNARVQVSQTSLEVRQERAGAEIAVPGRVQPVWEAPDGDLYLTTTAFVKYHYIEGASGLTLKQVTTCVLPNGYLQDRYNPSTVDGIWNAGPDSPARNEKFRTRLNFRKLEQKASWRVQRLVPGEPWVFKG